MSQYEHGGMGTGDVALVEMWTFRGAPGMSTIDLSGYEVEATDGKIGKIDEATYETGGSYLVVDTGPWIFGKKVILPAGVVDRIDPDTESVFVRLSKDEIKSAPELDADAMADETAYRGRIGEYYGGLRR